MKMQNYFKIRTIEKKISFIRESAVTTIDRLKMRDFDGYELTLNQLIPQGRPNIFSVLAEEIICVGPLNKIMDDLEEHKD